MDFGELIIRFLGLQDVEIEDVKLFERDLRCEVTVRQKRDRGYCSKCGEIFSHIKEWDLKILRAPPMGIYQFVRLKFFQLRGFCMHCKKSEVNPALFIHSRFNSITCGLFEVAGRLMEETTCEAASRLLNLNSKLMWQIDQHRMEVMLQYLKLPDNLDVTHLSADEVHFRTHFQVDRVGLLAKRWTPQFVTNLVCVKESKVLWNAMGRDQMALRSCLSVLSLHQLDQVKYFAVDLHEAFIGEAKRNCLNSKIVVDRFHLVQNINKVFDEVRRLEFKRAKETNNQLAQNLLLPHRKFILMAREKWLSKSEQKLLDRLRFENHRIHEALLLIESFHVMLDKKTISGFREALVDWYLLVRESKLKPFIRFAKTIRRYRKNIEAYITSRLTTAVSEGINNKIKVLKRMAYNYSNPVSFLRKILQRCGYLNSQHINTHSFFFHSKPR